MPCAPLYLQILPAVGRTAEPREGVEAAGLGCLSGPWPLSPLGSSPPLLSGSPLSLAVPWERVPPRALCWATKKAQAECAFGVRTCL